MELKALNPNEKSRLYVFPNNEKVRLENVTEFFASSTTHRLKTADGRLHIIPMGWIHIEIEADSFTL